MIPDWFNICYQYPNPNPTRPDNFFQYPNPTRPEVKKPYPSAPAQGSQVSQNALFSENLKKQKKLIFFRKSENFPKIWKFSENLIIFRKFENLDMKEMVPDQQTFEPIELSGDS